MEAQPLFRAPPPCVLLVGGRAFILFPILFFYTPLYHFFVVLLSGHLTYSSLCLRCYRLVRVSILVPFSSPTRSASHRPFNFHVMESTVCPYTIPYHHTISAFHSRLSFYTTISKALAFTEHFFEQGGGGSISPEMNFSIIIVKPTRLLSS